MIYHTIQPGNVKRFVNLNHPDGLKDPPCSVLDSFKQRFYFNREISLLIGNQSSESPEEEKGRVLK
jgi:hypothetical protein